MGSGMVLMTGTIQLFIACLMLVPWGYMVVIFLKGRIYNEINLWIRPLRKT